VTAQPRQQFARGHEWIAKSRAQKIRSMPCGGLDVARPNAWGLLRAGLEHAYRGDIAAFAQAFINVHYTTADIGDLTNLAVAATATQVDITATARVGTALLSIFSTPFIDITVSSKVFRQQRKIELVMVLDNSGSKTGTKLVNLKPAAHGLVDILFGSATHSPNVKIVLVPFTAAVNVGSGKIGSSWLHQTGLSPIHRDGIDLPTGHTLLSLIGSLTNSGWGGCVRARVGSQGYDLTDQPPDPLVGETLFVPYFAPHEPGSGNWPAFSEWATPTTISTTC
jgi:hypothetical protein